MELFREISVWKKLSSIHAVVYVGLEDLSSGNYWIALGNYLHLDEDGDVVDGGHLTEGLAEKILSDTDSNKDWRSTIREAILIFEANNDPGNEC
jgi:hypothetical protein